MGGAGIARALIQASARTPFRGRGGYGVTAAQASASGREERFRQAFAEAATVDRFYSYFPELPAAFAGKRVLDWGCGYGGKTVEYARHAASASGVEPFANLIDLARQYAAAEPKVDFRVCDQATIPYPDASFDVVVSHDVLEHVANPEVSLQEVRRVLAPGGVAYLVFPPYDGAFSHHLDYVSLLPGLHWFFSPDTLVSAANGILRQRPELNTAEQPAPSPSWTGSRKVLPTLNGLTGPEFERLADRYFPGARIEYCPIGHGRTHPVAKLLERSLRPLTHLGPGIRDRVTYSIAARLTRPPA